MQGEINLSLFDMFDSDNKKENITNNSVEGTQELSLFDFLDSANEEKSNDVSEDDTLEHKEEAIINEDKIKINDKVYVEYGGENYIGVVHSIYNEGNTVNVIFEQMHSAFHISKVKKL